MAIENGLRIIAQNMHRSYHGEHTEDDFYELVLNAYQRMCIHYSEQIEGIDEDTILIVIRKEMNELMRFGRGYVGRLLDKRHNI